MAFQDIPSYKVFLNKAYYFVLYCTTGSLVSGYIELSAGTKENNKKMKIAYALPSGLTKNQRY